MFFIFYFVGSCVKESGLSFSCKLRSRSVIKLTSEIWYRFGPGACDNNYKEKIVPKGILCCDSGPSEEDLGVC